MHNQAFNTRFSFISDFCYHLEECYAGTWSDDFGEYKISIDSKDVYEKIQELQPSTIICSKECEKVLPWAFSEYDENDSDIIMSIGAFKEHNKARRLCEEKHKQLITVPAPLSNDSFGTNRIQFPNHSHSYEGKYPSVTFFVPELINEFPDSANILGMGEFIGLYFSTIDYFYSRHQPVSEEILNFVVTRTNLFPNNNSSMSQKYLAIFVNLVYKCLIMRENRDHQIGCGIDHLFGGVIERTLQIPHGTSVFLGSIMSLFLFPKWEQFGIDIPQIVTFGKKNGLLSQKIFDKIISTINPNQLIKDALAYRPNRTTVLRTISSDLSRDRWEELLSLIS